MNDNYPPQPLQRSPEAALIAAVRTSSFTEVLMNYINEAADIANFGAFFVADMNHPAPVLSIWEGRMSSYWFNRNAQTILANDEMFKDTLNRILAAQHGQLSIERFQPGPDYPGAQIYARDKVVERVTVSSCTGRVGLMSFYLRGEEAGLIKPDEMERLQNILPVAHELIGLRHHLVGSNAFRFSAKERVSALRHRDAGSFGNLSPREAEVCDNLIQGISVSGTALNMEVSENTVRTLRRRAYEKLGVHSATQIAALILNAEVGPS